MPAFDEVEAYAGTERIVVRGTLTGADNRFFEDGQQKRNFWAIYPRFRYPYTWGEVIEEGAHLAVEHELCAGSASGTRIEPKPISELKKDLEAPEILEPVCPEARVVQVKTSLSSGKLQVEFAGNEHVTTGAGAAWTEVVVPKPQELTAGSAVRAWQVMFGEAGGAQNIVSPEAKVLVDDVTEFLKHDATTYAHQITGETVEGYVREESIGPKFSLRCCSFCKQDPNTGLCDGEEGPREANVSIIMDGTKVDDVTLYEEYPGYFTGRWDWFMEDGKTDPWPPPASREYTAVLDSSPCEQTGLKQSFDVLIGEPNTGDDTAPERINLKVTDSEGTTGSVDEGGTAATVEVMPLETSEVDVDSFDPEGLDQAAIATGATNVDTPKSRSSDPNVVPIPPDIPFSTTLDGPEPYATFDLSAKAINYSQVSGAQETESGTLTVKGKHPDPVIDSFTPDELYSDQTLTIDGEHLAYGTLTTEVWFTTPDGDQKSPSLVASQTQLTDVALPSGLEGHFGTSDVWVKTIYNDPTGPIEKESDPVTIQLLDRSDSFHPEGADNFENTGIDTHITECSSNSDVGGVTDVWIEDAVNNDAQVRIESNGHSDEVIVFDIASAGNGAPDLGGVAVFENACRVVAVLSDTGQDTPAKFNLVWLHFPKDTSESPQSRIIENVRLHHDDGTTYQYVPHAFQLFANGKDDGSVVAAGYPNLNSSVLSVWGQINDMLTVHGPDENDRNQSAKQCPSSCDYSMNLDVRDVEFEVDAEELVYWTLGE